MNKRFLGLLITLGAVVILMAADMTITSYWPDDGDSDRKLLAKQAAALYDLTESLAGYGTNIVRTTNMGGSVSGSMAVTNNVSVYTLAGTNLSVEIAGGTNYIDALNPFPVYTPTDTNLNVLIASSSVTTNLQLLADSLAGYGTNKVQIDATFSGTVTTETNINIGAFTGVTESTPLYVSNVNAISVSGDMNVTNLVYVEGTVGISNLVYVEGSVGITNTPSVTLSDTNIGATVLNTVTVTLSDTNVGATIVGTPTVTLSDTNVGATILNTVTTTLSDTNVGATILNTASVVGLTTIATVTPYITNIAYVDGDVMSHYAVLDVARAAGKAVQLQSVTVIDADDEGMAFEIMLFEAAPTLALPGDAWATSDADMLNCATFVSIGTSDYTDLGANRIANVGSINKSITPDSGTSIFMGLRARGTSTFTNTNDVTIKLVFYQD